MIKLSFLFLIVPVLFLGCSDSKKNVKIVLENAGKNRDELEKVIQYYKEKKDSEKLKAAYFLIGNMQNKYGHYGDFVQKYFPVFEKVHFLTDKKTDKDTIEKVVKKMWDSIETVCGPITPQNFIQAMDCNVITSEFLIENIDYAFKAWEEKPWAQHINFDQFCEFILPYRIYDEPLQFYRKKFYHEFSWLADSLKDKNDPIEACTVLNNFLAKKFVFCDKLEKCPMLGVNDMYKLQAGICEHRYFLVASIMRSQAIPVGIDQTPQYNRWAGQHSWMVLLDKNGKARSFNGGEPKITFPDSVYIAIGSGYTTKVYRNTFAIQPDALVSKVPPKNIPFFFQNPCIIDVTNGYDFPQQTLKIELKEKSPSESKFVYLCCFGYSYYLAPFAYTKNSGTTAKFSHVGLDGIYVPIFFNENEYVIADNPHVVPKKSDKPEYLNPDKSKMITVKLTRKYPVGGTMMNFAKSMIGAKLQASDNKNFSNPVTLFTIDSSYYCYAEKEVKNEKPFRYYRYLSTDTGRIRIADIDFVCSEFETIKNKSTVFRIFGNALKDSTGIKAVFKNAFDGDISTNLNAPPRTWVAIEYGKPVKVTKVRFLVRNDLNVVEIGDQYELLYFDFGWQSLGKVIADKNYLIYSNVPDNALLLLRDLTKGQEERIFLYRNGQQIWW
jgi:hypothetical protein